jgi:hypothetical protein
MHCPGLQTFFWDKLPQGRVAGTFWAAHPPDYSLLSSSIPEAEELFQVPSTGCSACARPFGAQACTALVVCGGCSPTCAQRTKARGRSASARIGQPTAGVIASRVNHRAGAAGGGEGGQAGGPAAARGAGP